MFSIADPPVSKVKNQGSYFTFYYIHDVKYLTVN